MAHHKIGAKLKWYCEAEPLAQIHFSLPPVLFSTSLPPPLLHRCWVQDTQWNDIDYMSDHLDFTYNTTTFAELPDLIANLHSHGQHYVLITDPGIGSMQPRGSYPPYDDGLPWGYSSQTPPTNR
jgi:hypothetical protein